MENTQNKRQDFYLPELITILNSRIGSSIPGFLITFDCEGYLNGKTEDLFKFYLGNDRIDGNSIAIIRQSNKNLYSEKLNDVIQYICDNMKKIVLDKKDAYKELYEEEIIERIASIRNAILDKDRIKYIPSEPTIDSDKKTAIEVIRVLEKKTIFTKQARVLKQHVG